MEEKVPSGTTRLQLAVVGYGQHFVRSHLPYLPQPPLGVFDPGLCDSQHRSQLALPPETRWYSSLNELLEDERVNAVFIASPDALHAQQLLQVIERGCHVFVEKPLALTEPDLALVSLAFEKARAGGWLISSCHPRRFDPPVVKLKSHLAQLNRSTLPRRLSSLWVHCLYHKPSAAWKLSRSLMKDHLGHELDLVHFLLDTTPAQRASLVVHEDSALRYRATAVYLERVSNTEAETQDGAARVTVHFDVQRTLDESLYLEQVEWSELDEVSGQETRHLLNLNSGLHTVAGSSVMESWPAKSYDVMFERVTQDFVSAVSQRLQGASPDSAQCQCYLSPDALLELTRTVARSSVGADPSLTRH